MGRAEWDRWVDLLDLHMLPIRSQIQVDLLRHLFSSRRYALSV